MFDFTKLRINSDRFASDLRQNPLLASSWSAWTNERTGNTLRFAAYNGLQFKIYPSGRVEIKGSLHKYKNLGLQNYDDFNYDDLLNVLSDLEHKFGPSILDTHIESLEYGLNISPAFKAKDFIQRVIVYLNRGAKLKQPITKDDSKGYTKGVRFNLEQYHIKLYAKGTQYNQGDNLLRIEFKAVKMQSINKVGIVYLRDLLNLDAINKFNERLIGVYDDILIREDVNEKQLTKTESQIYTKCINDESWVSMNKYQRRDKLAQFKAILHNHGQTDVKIIVRDLLVTKHGQLLQSSLNAHHDITGLVSANAGVWWPNDIPRIITTHFNLPKDFNATILPSFQYDNRHDITI